MRNQYPGTCLVCQKPVAANAGWFQKNITFKRPEGGKRGSAVPTATVSGAGKWLLRCTDCKGKGNTPSNV